jgi:hypothetical protein
MADGLTKHECWTANMEVVQMQNQLGVKLTSQQMHQAAQKKMMELRNARKSKQQSHELAEKHHKTKKHHAAKHHKKAKAHKHEKVVPAVAPVDPVE